jgi:hypothetical protein
MIERVSREVQKRFETVAELVRNDLRLAGFSLVERDGHSGVSVFVDPFLDGESEGVFVEWRLSSDLTTTLKRCIERGDMENPAIPFGVSVVDTMKECLKGLLEGAGWRVETEYVGVHESSIKVSCDSSAAERAGVR